MVDIVDISYIVRQANQVADGGHDIVRHDMARDQVVNMFLIECDLAGLVHPFAFLHKLNQRREVHVLVQAGFNGIKGKEMAGVDKLVAQRLEPAAALQPHKRTLRRHSE